MQSLGAILDASGSSYARVVKTTILMSDIANFAKINAVYAKYFPENPPARAAYAVRDLPLGVKVEIEAVALAP